MSYWSSLLTWANVPFVVALGVAVTFSAVRMSGLLGALAGDGDGDADGDGEADGDGDADAEDGDADESRSVFASLGAGKVPTTLLWQVYAASFAFAGLAANAVYLARFGAAPAYSLAWTVPFGVAVGGLVTRSVARPLGRLLANDSDDATSRAELVGQTAIVISSRVTTEFGEVRVRDRSGHVVRLIVRARVGEIPEGAEVVLVDADV